MLNRIRAHKGVDYAAPTGTPVRAAGDGRVQFAGRKGGYGNVARDRTSARRRHAVRPPVPLRAKACAPARRVTQGDVIGYVGMSGLATGPHLHYEYRLNGVHKNPQTVEAAGRDADRPGAARRLPGEDGAWRSPSLELAYGPALVSR